MSAENYDANSPNVGLGLLQNSDGTSASAAIFTAAADGAKVGRIRIHSGPTTAPGGTFDVVVLHNAVILDEFAVTDSVDTLQYDKIFNDLYLEGGDTIKLQCRTALAAGSTLHVAVWGHDYEEYLPTPVTPGAVITLDVTDNGTVLSWTAGEDETVSTSGTQVVGQRLVLFITNDATPRTITFSTGFTPNGTLIGEASTTCRLLFISDGTNFCEISRTIQPYVALYPGTSTRNIVTPTGTGINNLTLDATSGHTAHLLRFLGYSSTTAQQVTAGITADFSVTTHASRTGRLTLYTYYTTTAQANVTMTAGASGVLYGLTSIGGYITAPRQGTANEVFGNLSGTAMTGSSSYNTMLGYQAGVTITAALGNTFVGYQAGNLTTGDYNVFIGHQARHSTASDSYGVAIGEGARSSGNGVAIARQAHSTGSGGVSIGYLSNAASECAALGENCIVTNSSIAIGYSQQNSAGNQCLIGNELSGDGTGSFVFGHKSADTYMAWMRDTSGVGSGTALFQMRMTPTWVVSTHGSHLSKFTLGVSDNSTERVGFTMTAVTGGVTNTLSSPLLGTNVAVVTTTATNDDPNYQIRQNRVATTDATVTTLETIAITASKTYLIEARVLARRTGGVAGTADDGACYIRRAMVTTKAGTVTINTVDGEMTQEDQAGWDCTLDVSGTDVRVRVTGAADNNVTWHSTVILQDVGS